MARYVASAGGDNALALELYGHQARVAATLWQTIGHVEVVVRNAMHEALSRRSEDWYDGLSIVFDPETTDDIRLAKERAAKRHDPPTPGHIVAELNFGFWRFLLARKYDRFLWVPYLHSAFPNHAGARAELFREMADLNDDRNAIAHHQRIANPKEVQKRCVRIAGYVCADAKAWVSEQCRVMAAIAEEPSIPVAPTPAGQE